MLCRRRLTKTGLRDMRKGVKRSRGVRNLGSSAYRDEMWVVRDLCSSVYRDEMSLCSAELAN